MIDNPKILLVEGKDEIGFFEALCKKIDINDIQIIETGGKDKFKDELPAIKNSSGFEKVISIAVIRDADNSVDAAMNSVKYYLVKNNLPSPSLSGEFKKIGTMKVGVFIMPGNMCSGMLENLVLETVADNPVKISADKYIDELKETLNLSTSLKFPKNEHKARLYAFLSGMEKYVPSLGMAAKKGYFNLDSPALDKIKKFINDI
jgi:hypothetical protein